jgi:Flp pilus assembly pilin Flp
MLDRFNLWVGELAARFQTLRTREDGQALVEYALILALVSVAAVGILSAMGVSIHDILVKINSDL